MRFLILSLAMLSTSSIAATPDRCFQMEKRGDVTVKVYQGDRKCVDLTEARELKGIWVNEFEGSAFHNGAGSLGEIGENAARVWLSMDRETLVPDGFEPKYGHAYRMTIIARTAQDMDRKPLEGYGHFGLSSGLVLVDEIVAWEDLGPAKR